MFYTVSFYFSFTIFLVGLLYKVSTWFRHGVGIDAQQIPTSTRVASAIGGMFSVLFSARVFTLFKVFILDVLFQVRTLRQDGYRWLMHMCIYWGFMVLLLMHALGKYTTAAFFPDYYSTVNPFLWLRDAAGILVVAGVLMAVYRRFVRNALRPATSAMDMYAMVIVAVIMLSGFVLHGVKITSNTVFQSMVEEFMMSPEEEEVKALAAYWVQDFGLISPELQGPFDAALLQQGKTAHEVSCMQCHSRPQWAPASYAASRIMAPLAGVLDRAGGRTGLFYLHVLACFLGLAYLPFSKMFHILTSPLSLMANAVMERGVSAPANMATKQMLELDACTHCGACTSRCAMAVTFGEIPNINILPSEKIASLKTLAAGRKLADREVKVIQQGLMLCTNCNRCTQVCPVGINLRDMWFSAREALLSRSSAESLLLSPLSFFRTLKQDELGQSQYREPVALVREAFASSGNGNGNGNGRHDRSVPFTLGEAGLLTTLNSSIQANSFARCYGCMTCSNGCPVARNANGGADALGLLPHQLMHAIRLRQWGLVFSSMMLWDCLGCYQCQQNCPQGVQVTDILYELKRLAVSRVDKDLE